MTPYRGAVAWRLDDPNTQAERLASFVPRANLEKISVQNLVMHLV